jgi:hypothetical protein
LQSKIKDNILKSSLAKGQGLKKRKEKQNEKDCKESGKDHCQELE